uniref:G domain-containing protein n=1 Tax=Dunaliella tertiolecta TaxID=3047 RepID=A0A7S3VQ92_DUNTE
MIVLHEAYHSLALPCKHLLDHLQEPCFAVPAPTSTSDVSGWLLLKGIHEAEALLPSPWQQKYLNVGQALVEPIDLKENMRQVVVLGPSGVGKSALIKHLTRAGNVAVGESKMTTLPERRHVRPDLQLWDMPGYNVWMHQGAEDTDDGTTPQTLTVLDFLCAEGHSELIDQADAVMYVVGNRGTARDGEILQRMMDYGKMIFLVITHCEELGYCGPFQESSAQNERAIIVRDTLKAIGTSGGLAAALERMPIFCVQCPLPHGLAYQSKERFEVVSQAAPRLRTQQLHEQQCAEWGRAIKCHAVGLGWPGWFASMVESVLDFNCKCFDFPALSDFLYSASGLSGQLLLQSCMGSMLQETLEGYIACKTAGLDAAPETSHEVFNP